MPRTPTRIVPSRSAPVKSTPVKSAKERSAPDKSVRLMFAPERSARVNRAETKEASKRSDSRNVASVKLHPRQKLRGNDEISARESCGPKCRPLRLAPEKSVPSKMPVSRVPAMLAPRKIGVSRRSLCRVVYMVGRISDTPSKLAPVKSVRVNTARSRRAPVRSAPLRLLRERSTPKTSALTSRAPLKSTSDRSSDEISRLEKSGTPADPGMCLNSASVMSRRVISAATAAGMNTPEAIARAKKTGQFNRLERPAWATA